MGKSLQTKICGLGLLAIMSIWNPEFNWPPPPPVAGGGESGGGGGSEDWPDRDCPIISMPWSLILDYLAPIAGQLYGAVYTNSEGALSGRFYINVGFVYRTGDIIYHGGGSWDLPLVYTSPTMWHNPYNGAVYEGEHYTMDDSVPGEMPRYFLDAHLIVRDGTHTDWLFWPAYQALYLVGDDAWYDECYQEIQFWLETAICTLPAPWAMPACAGGNMGQPVAEAIICAGDAMLLGVAANPPAHRRRYRQRLEAKSYGS
jgi:hypothetical protein